jgi:glycosyltransferase involved in cell wall biosynthesis
VSLLKRESKDVRCFRVNGLLRKPCPFTKRFYRVKRFQSDYDAARLSCIMLEDDGALGQDQLINKGSTGVSFMRDNMKVLLVNKLYYPHIGGVENHVRILANGLRAEVEVEVLAANEQLKTVTEFIDDIKVIKVASFGRLKSAPLAPGLATQLKRMPSDVYHYHFPNPTGELAYLMAQPKGKLVVTYHSDIVRQKTLLKFYKPFLELFLNRADRVLVNSPNQIEGSQYLQRIKDKCVIVPFGLNNDWLMPTKKIEEQAAIIRKKYGPKIALFIGRLIYYKGVDYLIKAMKHVEGKAIIVGEGPLENELKKLAEECGVTDKVDFVGFAKQDELAAYYHACDIFVLPSIEPSEAYGAVQLEAHACGKPVICTDLPTGVPFVNQDGYTGLVVPVRDEISLAEAIERLLSNDSLRVKLGAQAKERFEKEFTDKIMVERIKKVYKDVTANS